MVSKSARLRRSFSSIYAIASSPISRDEDYHRERIAQRGWSTKIEAGNSSPVGRHFRRSSTCERAEYWSNCCPVGNILTSAYLVLNKQSFVAVSIFLCIFSGANSIDEIDLSLKQGSRTVWLLSDDLGTCTGIPQQDTRKYTSAAHHQSYKDASDRHPEHPEVALRPRTRGLKLEISCAQSQNHILARASRELRQSEAHIER